MLGSRMDEMHENPLSPVKIFAGGLQKPSGQIRAIPPQSPWSMLREIIAAMLVAVFLILPEGQEGRLVFVSIGLEGTEEVD